jgi:hypothetical protein
MLQMTSSCQRRRLTNGYIEARHAACNFARKRGEYNPRYARCVLCPSFEIG